MGDTALENGQKSKCKGYCSWKTGKICGWTLYPGDTKTCKSCDAAPGMSPAQNAPTKLSCANCNGKKTVLRCLDGKCLYINPLSNTKCKMCDSCLFKFNSEKCAMC